MRIHPIPRCWTLRNRMTALRSQIWCVTIIFIRISFINFVLDVCFQFNSNCVTYTIISIFYPRFSMKASVFEFTTMIYMQTHLAFVFLDEGKEFIWLTLFIWSYKLKTLFNNYSLFKLSIYYKSKQLKDSICIFQL